MDWCSHDGEYDAWGNYGGVGQKVKSSHLAGTRCPVCRVRLGGSNSERDSDESEAPAVSIDLDNMERAIRDLGYELGTWNEGVSDTAQQYAGLHLQEIEIQFGYIKLALENR